MPGPQSLIERPYPPGAGSRSTRTVLPGGVPNRIVEQIHHQTSDEFFITRE